MRVSIRTAALCSLLLAACGGGGNNDGGGNPGPGPGPIEHPNCVFVPGGESVSEVVGSTPQNLEAVNDGDLSSFGSLGGNSSVCCGNQVVTVAVHGNEQYPSGGKAGLFITLPLGMTTSNISISTLLGGTTQDTATGAALGDVANPSASPATDYYYVTTTKPFDEIDLGITGNLTGEIDMFEFCADGSG